MTVNISRRTALRRAAFIAAGVAVGSQVLSSPAHAASRKPEPDKVREAVRRAEARRNRVVTGAVSRNGWEMEKVADDHGSIYTRPAPGTPVDLRIRMGEVETVLVHVVRRFHYEIDPLRKGEVVGWRTPASVRNNLAESNQASGTAVQIRPGFYPSGARGGFYPLEELVIRDILAECEGVIRWGGDDSTPDESLFYIDVPPGDERLVRVALKIRGWAYTPGRGSGVLVDPLQPRRRKAAERLAAQQA
ncbi:MULTISPECIES: twin-arginine translocation signal domain-containing protein [Streptomyces]|uniref:Twin-arginine translocation signal domain-containing protein n=1 Tax=Streptomyces fimbriatus TaxID=68197 RepID=A0ABW0DAP4_STRFI|nr:twin-arginine translocation signal domain-containing protein [Streptomyces sp.]